MSDSPSTASADNLSREERASALFGNLVVQQANMALLYLGRLPHPETGKPEVDLEAAQLFIDQLEMLEARTKGNLSPDEANLLSRSLAMSRMAFVDAVEHPPAAPADKPPVAPGSAAAPPPAEAAESTGERKRFTKKY
jgi:hypothetical protein